MRRRELLAGIGGLGLMGLAGPSMAEPDPAPALRPVTPVCDHHQHLLSPMAVELAAPAPTPAVQLPPDIAVLAAAREKGWNDKAALAPLYAEDAVLLDPFDHAWLQGRDKAADYMGGLFGRPFQITATSFRADGGQAHVEGYFTRGQGAAAKHFGTFQWVLAKGSDGVWRVAAESPGFPGPGAGLEPIDAARLVAMLDEIWIRRAVVLSLGYWYGSPLHPPVDDELGKTRAENDWTADQCARYPERLTAFCSVNPLKDYAVDEVVRCARSGRFKGLKLHFGNSKVDAKKPEHIVKVKQVFAAANAQRLGIVAHLWTSDRGYGALEARSFLDNLLPAAPDVAVQIAHMAGGGPGWTDPALEVFADAVAGGDPRTRNLYFDVATVADKQGWDELRLLARRIRQIGLRRILYGSDAAFGGNSPPRGEWQAFRGTVPLTDAEFKVIAGNLAPYLRA